MRIMLVVILISIIFDWFHIFQILFDIGIGWLAMTGWRALAIQAPSGWGNALSDATIAIFATALVVALIDIRVSPRVKREKQPKKVSKNQEAKPKAQAKQQRLTREQKKAVEKRKQEAMDKMGYGDPENYQPQFPEEGVTTSHEVPVFLRRNREQG
ncbi:MAG: hypothetical protein IJ867_00045 [Clostridia bacterium]|nr:hypothetical protein [Clostridia bacterium]